MELPPTFVDIVAFDQLTCNGKIIPIVPDKQGLLNLQIVEADAFGDWQIFLVKSKCWLYGQIFD